MCCVLASDPTKHDTFEQTIASESVIPMDTTGHFSSRKQPWEWPLLGRRCVHLLNLGTGADLQPSHAVVQRRRDISQEEMVVIFERQWEDGFAKCVVAAPGRISVSVECLVDDVNTDAEFLCNLCNAPYILDQSLEAIEAHGRSTEPVNDFLCEKHGCNNWVAFDTLGNRKIKKNY